MTTLEAPLRKSPIAFFDIVVHFGGSFQSMAQLAGQLKNLTDVVFIDAYGTCNDFQAALKAEGVPTNILFPKWSGQTTIGGETRLQRLIRMGGAWWNIYRLVIRLRHACMITRPRALVVTGEKSLFIAWLAVPRDLPIIFYLQTELHNVRPYCIPAWRRADMVISVSRNNTRYLERTKYAHQNIRVVRYGIDMANTLKQAACDVVGLPACEDDVLRIIFPASFGSALKGHEVGIRALHQYCQTSGKASLWLCGNVPTGASPAFYNQMRQLVIQLGLDNYVHFLGWRSDILAVMRQSDIVFLPSFTEGMPRSLLESMCLAKPVASTTVGGISELVRDGMDGFLVEPGDIDAIVRSFRLLEAPATRARMGAAGRQHVSEGFTLTEQVESFLSAVGSLATPHDDLNSI